MSPTLKCSAEDDVTAGSERAAISSHIILLLQAGPRALYTGGYISDCCNLGQRRSEGRVRQKSDWLFESRWAEMGEFR